MSHVAAGLKAAFAIALSQLAFGSHAQPADAGSRPAPSAQVVEQKFVMVDKVLNQSPVAGRVLGSGNERARRHIASARDLLARARALSASGMLRGADALLNDAIGEIGRAQQLVPDPASQRAAERVRFSQLEDSVAALQRAAMISTPQAGSRQAEAAQRITVRAAELVSQAGSLADANRYLEANNKLDEALLMLLRDASARLAGHTIVYDRRFADRREEFAFEVDRHRSFERLVPLALLELRPNAEARLLVNRYVAQARELRDRGQALIDRDPLIAIKHVVDGTDTLKRALQAAGLVVPQTLEAQ